MQMSRAYLEETVAAMGAAGFTVAGQRDRVTRQDGTAAYDRDRFELERGSNEDLVLECLRYADGRETFWLELRRVLTMRATPFQLDSWKCWPDRVEFRFYARDDGVALTFTLAL